MLIYPKVTATNEVSLKSYQEYKNGPIVGIAEIYWSVTVTVYQRNVPLLTCYTLDIHDPITIFGSSVTKKVRNHMTLCFPPHLSSASALPCEKETQKITHWCTVHATQSLCTAAALSTSFFLNHAFLTNRTLFTIRCANIKLIFAEKLTCYLLIIAYKT